MGSLRLVALVVPAFGCATAGSAWVSEPEPGPFAADELTLSSEHSPEALDESRASALLAEPERDGGPMPRPRLSRTVTLGEVAAAYSERGAPVSPGEHAVNVTINNYVAAPAPSYDGYYAAPYVAGYRSLHDGGAHPSHPIAAPSPAPSHPGQNWPALPSYGPSFPFKTAPASPWR